MSQNMSRTESQSRADTTADPLARAARGESLGERVADFAAEEWGVTRRLIDFCAVPTVQTDDGGRAYIEDMNHVVRYFLGSGNIELTEDYCEAVEVVNHNQHAATTVEGMVLQ